MTCVHWNRSVMLSDSDVIITYIDIIVIWWYLRVVRGWCHHIMCWHHHNLVVFQWYEMMRSSELYPVLQMLSEMLSLHPVYMFYKYHNTYMTIWQYYYHLVRAMKHQTSESLQMQCLFFELLALIIYYKSSSKLKTKNSLILLFTYTQVQVLFLWYDPFFTWIYSWHYIFVFGQAVFWSLTKKGSAHGSQK